MYDQPGTAQGGEYEAYINENGVEEEVAAEGEEAGEGEGEEGGEQEEEQQGEGEGEGVGEGEGEGADSEEPLYVNAKQYQRIVKRRMARARLEELNRLSRSRKVCPKMPFSTKVTTPLVMMTTLVSCLSVCC